MKVGVLGEGEKGPLLARCLQGERFQTSSALIRRGQIEASKAPTTRKFYSMRLINLISFAMPIVTSAWFLYHVLVLSVSKKLGI